MISEHVLNEIRKLAQLYDIEYVKVMLNATRGGGTQVHVIFLSDNHFFRYENLIDTNLTYEEISKTITMLKDYFMQEILPFGVHRFSITTKTAYRDVNVEEHDISKRKFFVVVLKDHKNRTTKIYNAFNYFVAPLYNYFECSIRFYGW